MHKNRDASFVTRSVPKDPHISDEAYAVANALDELKQVATGVIEGNNNDGVAKWLIDNV